MNSPHPTPSCGTCRLVVVFAMNSGCSFSNHSMETASYIFSNLVLALASEITALLKMHSIDLSTIDCVNSLQ